MNSEEKFDLILQGFKDIRDDLSDLKAGQRRLDFRIDRSETELKRIDKRLSDITNRLDRNDSRLDGIETDISDIKTNVKYIWEDIFKQDKQLTELKRVL